MSVGACQCMRTLSALAAGPCTRCSDRQDLSGPAPTQLTDGTHRSGDCLANASGQELCAERRGPAHGASVAGAWKPCKIGRQWTLRFLWPHVRACRAGCTKTRRASGATYHVQLWHVGCALGGPVAPEGLQDGCQALPLPHAVQVHDLIHHDAQCIHVSSLMDDPLHRPDMLSSHEQQAPASASCWPCQ